MIKKILFTFFLFLFYSNFHYSLASINNKIIVKVENQIVSSYELKNKIRTLLILSQQEITQQNIDLTKQRALQQLIDFNLKKIQIEKFNIKENDNKKLEQYMSRLASKFNTDANGIKKIFLNNNLNYEIYINEIKTEYSWQKLIYSKFKKELIIDDQEINNDLNRFIKEQKNIKEFNLAEIEIVVDSKNSQEILTKLKNEINEIGFGETAVKYSVSSTSLDNGNIGWISSKSLSPNVLQILDKMKIGDISEPIVQTNTVTFLKLLDTRYLKIKNNDLKTLREKIITNKKNELLNIYSNNYLSKIKNNAFIEFK